MELNEFKAWLEGYTFAGGRDVEVIKAKLAEVYNIVPFKPFSPWDTIGVPIYPQVPAWPWTTTTWTGSPDLGNDIQVWLNAALQGIQVLDEQLNA